jgi:hypothetical protein
MARRGVRLTILCEDDEHQQFARHVFLNLNFSRHELRFEIAPSGRGSGAAGNGQRALPDGVAGNIAAMPL